jgi:manganese/zinc/iron transport system permease protein
MLAPGLGLNGKSLPVLLTGAALSGLVGVASILLIRNLTRLREDAALGIVLSVSFGAGIALLSIIQQSAGHAAGLESFIYGKTASMVATDAWLIGVSGLFCVAVMMLSFKELTLLCFDEGFAGSRGFPVILMDMMLMAMVVIVTIIGLQAVGLVLMIAMLVIPAAAARFWTENIRRMTVISAGLGAFSGLVGSGLSAVFPRLPSGAMIVLICSASFFVSMLCGPARGVIVRFFRRWSLNRSVNRQHLLRGIYEYLEAGGMIGPADVAGKPVPFSEILRMRSWSAARLIRQISRSERQGLVVRHGDRSVSLTQSGSAEAARLVHEHRLWELYLITHAEIAPSRVDRDADTIEHVLDAAMIQQLEDLLEQRQAVLGVVQSPHPVTDTSADGSTDPRDGMISSRNAGRSEIRREGL